MAYDTSRLDDLADAVITADKGRMRNSGECGISPPPGETGELGENLVRARVSSGRKMGEPGRISPLAGPNEPFSPPDYPLDALGALAVLARAIAEQGQVDPAMAGQSVLAAAALAVQGGHDVETLTGAKPMSLFALTIGESGDGKSLAESVALGEFQRYEVDRHREYVAKKTEAKQEETKPRKDRKPVEIPTPPYVLMKNATAQGIWRSFRDGVSSQGSFTAEAAVMLCGWGMSAEQRANTAGSLNDIWDGSPISIVRGSDERTQLYGKRFAAHWLVQPEAATEALHDPLLSGIGFWPRFLVAWPRPMQPRTVRLWKYGDDPVVKGYWDRCRELLEKLPAPADEAGRRSVIGHEPDAYELACRFFERMEQQARGAGGKLVDIKPFAVRATEQAFRIAGVAAVFGGKTLIDKPTMAGAIHLVGYSLETWQGIFGSRQEHEQRLWAQQLYLWIRDKSDGRATETSMLKRATPKTLRSKHRRDTAMAILQAEGLLAPAKEFTAGGGDRLIPQTWVTVDA